MTKQQRRDWVLGLLGGALVGALPSARAQSATWPARSVRLVAPVAPGGGVDLVARTMADRLGRALGQTFIVENLAGGGGVIASQTVARAAPDGYTLMVGYVATHGTSPAVRKLPYDAVKDFAPIGMVGGTPNVLVVHPDVPARTLAEFVAFAKSRPGKLSYGSAGQGSLTHLAMEQFKLAAGFFAVHVPYRGIGPAITDLLGAQTQAMMPGLAAAQPHIGSGRMRPIAVTGRSRHRLLPEIPSFEESGFRGFDGVQWYGIVGPARMPPEIVRRLNDEINRALGSPDLRDKLAAEALDPMPMSPEQFAQYIQDDIGRWSRLARERKIEID